MLYVRATTVSLVLAETGQSRAPRRQVVECPSNFGDLLTDFELLCYIVHWLIARPLPPSRERSVQDYPSYPRK